MGIRHFTPVSCLIRAARAAEDSGSPFGGLSHLLRELPIQGANLPGVTTTSDLLSGMIRSRRLQVPVIEEFDQEIIDELRNRAKDALLTRAIAKEEVLGDVEPAEDLLTMEGMDRKLAYQLASRGVVSMEDLAEQSIDELLEIEGMDEERAGALIMTARAPWFAESAE